MRRSRTAAVRLGVLLVGAALAVSGCSGGGTGAGTADAGKPQRGGTLRVIGSGDVDHMDTAAAYYTVSFSLQRLFTRQLYATPNKPGLDAQETPVPDLASGMPEVSDDLKTYTINLREGAMWDTNPPRQVTAEDAVLGFKRLCNPVQPSGAIAYYTDTIVGMSEYCDAFAKVPPKVPQIKEFITTHDVEGIKAVDELTLEIELIKPASDFLSILALPFSSPAPEEYLDYLPDGAEFRQNLISDGPYSITSYKPGKHIMLERNPAWDASTDPVREAYVDKVEIMQGFPDASTALQRVQAGEADLFWDQVVPAAQLAGLRVSKDSGLVIGPDAYYSMNPYLAINLRSPNNDGALKNVKVRQALQYAVDKVAVSQVYGGPAISQPLNQAVPGGSGGFIDGYDPYSTPGDEGDPAKAKQLLKEAGYEPGEITLKMPFRTNSVHPQVGQTIQASLAKAGFDVKLFPVQPDPFYTEYLQNPDAGARGEWDIAGPGWVPDWVGNNGRSIISPLYDGRHYGPGSTNYGGYNSAAVNNGIDEALTAASPDEAEQLWETVNKQVMEDAVIVPLAQQKVAVYKSSRLGGCNFMFFSTNCDFPNVWVK